MFLTCRLLLGALLLGAVAHAEPLNDSLMTGATNAHFYEGASIFANPAALAYQTELNGPAFNLSTLGAFNRTVDDAFGIGVALGYLGLGYERLTDTTGSSHRYSLGLGAPLTPYLFAGARITFLRPRTSTATPYDSVDLGLQIRLLKQVAFSLQANHLNEPLLGATALRTQWVASAIVRPIDPVELTLDVDTSSGTFLKTVGYQATAAYTPFDGFQIRAGYHDKYQAQIGVRFDLGQVSLTAVTQPSNRERTVVVGVHSSVTPRPSLLTPPVALELTFDNTLREEPVEGNLFLPDTPSLWQRLRSVEEAGRRDDVELVIVNIESFPLGLGPATEVFDALLALRKQGKKTIAYLKNAGPTEYLIASAAERIHLAPGSQLRMTGLASSRLFLKGGLDKLGIQGEILARGKYKSAPETFTRKESSPESKEVTFSLLKDLDGHLSRRYAQSGRIQEGKWEALQKLALLGSKEAVEQKLVDDLGVYASEKRKLQGAYLITNSLVTYKDRLNLPPRLAIVHASGNILEGSRGLGLLGGEALTPDSIEPKYRAVNASPRVKGVVLRVSSPGGEVGPSYAIAGHVEESAALKPHVVSMGSVAASGGYLIAAPGSRIFATDSTLTGSIGVFIGKPNLKGLLGKIDLNLEILSRSPHADLMAWDRPFSKEGREIMERQLGRYYDDFTQFVAKHRKMAQEKVETAAQGRVWTGAQAKGQGLVDEVGGLLAAVDYSRKQIGLGDEVEVVELGRHRGLFDFFSADTLLGIRQGEALQVLPSEVRDALPWLMATETNPFLLLAPVAEVK